MQILRLSLLDQKLGEWNQQSGLLSSPVDSESHSSLQTIALGKVGTIKTWLELYFRTVIGDRTKAGNA